MVLKDGRVEVVLRDRDLIESRAMGAISRNVVLAGLRDVDAILARHEGRFRFLTLGLEVESVDPGMPIVSARWAAPRANRFRSSALVVQTPTLLAVGRAFRYLLPSIPIGVFRTRAEAIGFLEPKFRAARSRHTF